MVMALVLGVITNLCCVKYGVSIVAYWTIGILFSIVILLIISRYYNWFVLSKYELIILSICLLTYGIGLYRCSYVSSIYQQYDRAQYEYETEEYTYMGEVVGIKENTYGYTITLQVEDGEIYVYSDSSLCGMLQGIEIDVENSYDDIYLQLYGKNIFVKGEVIPMKKARNYGNYDEYTSLRSKGVLLKINASSMWLEYENEKTADNVKGDNNGSGKTLTIKNIVVRLKIYLKSVLHDIATDEEYGILAAMVLGENDDVDKEVKELYSLSGISHIMAISGLHISLIGMGIYKLLRRKMRYVTSAIISMSIMIFFLMFIGSPISATRAIIMFFVHMIADLYGRKYDVLSALSLAGIFLLLDNPYYLLNMSFQLSFMAMIAVTVFAPIVSEFVFFGTGEEKDSVGSDIQAIGVVRKRTAALIKTIGSRFGKIIAFNITLCIVLMPLNTFLFFRHSTYSPFINMIVVPLVGIVVIMTLCGMLVAIFLPGAGKFLVGTAIYLLRFFTWLSEKVVLLPKSSIVTGKLALGQVALSYILLVACVIFMFCYKEGKLNKWLSKRKIYLVVFSLMSILFFLIFREKYNGFSVNFLDVGQGAAIYIKSESGNDYLIDGGSSDEKNIGEYKLESFLEARQVDSLEYVFVTHCDTDHISGIIELMERENITINVLVLPDITGEERDEKYWELVNLAKEKDIDLVYMNAGDKLRDGRLCFTCVNPVADRDIVNSINSDINEKSLVLVAEYKSLACIFTGDIGKETEKGLVPLIKQFDLQEKIVIYDVAHHGSRNSNSQEIIDVVQPGVSVISCGKDNSYGHPAKEVLERLEAVGSEIWCTYESGQIEVYEGKDGIMVRGYVGSGGIMVRGFVRE